ncbi:MAG: double-strand break repair protein AddB [Pararhizobium sp.]
MRDGAERLFTIPPGVPFLRTLAGALCEGRLVAGFRHDPADPLALSRATIFVPTRRAARALRSEFVDRLGGGSAILPVIRPLGEIDDDAGFFEPAVPAALDLDPPIGGVDRLMELARLILAWKKALPKAVSAVHADNPLIAPANPADAVWLARGLADLLEAMETEERPWSALEALDAADHAEWWQLTLEFLKIARDFWPARLKELARSSPAAHRNALLRAEAARLASVPPRGPVVVAGSTGSLPATAELIKAVLGLREGAVVLPGLDRTMTEEQWRLVATGRAEPAPTGPAEDPAARAHPQYGLHSLLLRLGCTREDARILAVPEEPTALRNRILSLALLPAAATEEWAEPDALPPPGETARGLAAVSLIEAANEREEAAAAAVAMRLALEGEAGAGAETQVALVTPDRGLARRVATELRRFGIEADDSGGVPLASTPQGSLLTLAVEAALRPGDPVALLALLKHPLARFGLSAGAARHAARMIELAALRNGTGEADAAALTTLLAERLAASEGDRHPPVWRSRMSPRDIAAAQDLAVRVEKAVEPLARRLVHRDRQGGGLVRSRPVADWARETGHVLEAIAIDEAGSLARLWGDEAGEALAALMGGLIESRAGVEVDEMEWAAMLPALLAGETVKPRRPAHPRVFIWGTLEARLQHVDTIVLAGLNEGTWPGKPANDPFLSRAMKMAVGLEPPERRVGQAAHDLQMAMGTRSVVLSRAARAGTEPTVASRWLQRLLAVVGEEAADAMRARGRSMLAWAETLDRVPPQPSAPRPEPRPPREKQPTNYSFSEVKTLRRDPYAIYARRVLRLDPIGEMVRDPSVAERGTLYHRILEEFVRAGVPMDEPLADETLRAITARCFAEAKLPPHVAATWRPRFDRVAELFLAWERARDGTVRRRLVEARARMPIEPLGVSLSGSADRIDLMADGTAEVIDYKTGASPSPKQARTLLDPQLPLEAGVLMLGGFRDLPKLVPSHLSYVRLRPGDVLKVEDVDNKKPEKPETRSAEELGEEALHQFAALVSLLASGERGFASRLIPASARDFGGEYDHLARVAEWSTAEEGEGNGDG